MFKGGIPTLLSGIFMSSVVDEKGRVIIPKHVAEELNLNKGDMIAFEKREHLFVVSREKGASFRRKEGGFR